MRLSFLAPMFFWGKDLCEVIELVAKLGYDAIETWNWKGLDLDRVKATLDANGVELVGMCTSEFRMNDPEFRKLWLDGLRESCEAAKRLGTKNLITQVGQDTGKRLDFQHQSIVDTS